MNTEECVMVRSYIMFGAYKRVDHGTYWTFHFLPYHSRNSKSIHREDTIVPKIYAHDIEFYVIEDDSFGPFLMK